LIIEEIDPTKRALDNESILKISIPLVEPVAFSITITGKTQHSSRDSETIAFSVTDKTKETILNFKDPLESITKNIPTKYDVTVKDIEDNIIAVIPNHQKHILYKVIQLTESEQFNMSYSAVEVFYKLDFAPAINDTDTFWGSDKYDQAILTKFKELFGTDDVAIGVANQMKANQLVKSERSDEDVDTREKIEFKPSPFLNPPYARTGYFRYYQS
jgi:hypothetical protein